MQHSRPSMPRLLMRSAIAGILLLFSVLTQAQVFPVDTIMKNGVRTNRINFVYVGDGYQTAELAKFVLNTQTINNAIFDQAPYAQYRNFFNSYAIKVPSNESGAIHPGDAADEPGNQPVADPDNYFQTTFDYASIHRLLVPQNNVGLFTVLANNLPDYDQGIVVVNSTYYGGSGGSYATGSTDASSTEVALHEIGHSFAGLADEYWAGISYASEKPNMTQNSDPSTIRWKNWLNINNIGIFPYGNVSPQSAWYRPHQNCKMQVLGVPFCSVCSERTVDRIHSLVNMIDSYIPVSTSFVLTNTNNVPFSITKIVSIPSTMKVNWYLNGSAYATNADNLEIPFGAFLNGNNTVKAEVVDTTGLSKSFLPGAGYVNSITWTVSKDPIVPVVLYSFNGKIDERKNGILQWRIDNPEALSAFDVEKSKDGLSFTRLGRIDIISSAKDYSFTDGVLIDGNNYYRLVLYEKDGVKSYSGIIDLVNPLSKFFYKVYQAGTGKQFHLLVRQKVQTNVSASVYNVSGMQVWNKEFKNMKDIDHDINLSSMPAGVYFLKLIIDHSSYDVKLIAE